MFAYVSKSPQCRFAFGRPGCALNRPTWSPIKGSSASVSTIRSAIVVRQRFFAIFWPLFVAGSGRLRDNRRMTDAAHNQHSENQHSETRRPSDRDRIVTTGPSRFQPARPEVLPEMMPVSVAGIPKNRCRTTIAEADSGNASGTALYRGPDRSVQGATRPAGAFGVAIRCYSPARVLPDARATQELPSLRLHANDFNNL